MTPEMLHAVIRLVLVTWFFMTALLVTRSLILAYHADYGWPWRKKLGANGRAAVDLRVITYMALFAVLGLYSVTTTVRRLGASGLEVSAGSLGVSVLVLLIDAAFFDLWRLARKERLSYGKKPPALHVVPATEQDEP